MSNFEYQPGDRVVALGKTLGAATNKGDLGSVIGNGINDNSVEVFWDREIPFFESGDTYISHFWDAGLAEIRRATVFDEIIGFFQLLWRKVRG